MQLILSSPVFFLVCDTIFGLGDCGSHLCNAQETEEVEPELHPLDGWFNNLIHPEWGAIDTVLLRKSPTAYTDGVFEMAGTHRPNPFEISQVAHRAQGLQELGLLSQRGRNAMITYFGQQVVEEIMDVQRPGCPREYENIDVPNPHDLYNPEPNNVDGLQMPFPRSRYDARTGYSPSNPRQQLNEITPYIDGQLMYGIARAWTDAIREFKGGRLLALDTTKPINESFPANNTIRLPFANPPNPREQAGSPPGNARLQPVARFWRLGNPRGFENPFLLSFGVLWFRWHNYLAMEIANEHGWTSEEDQLRFDETIFTEARKKVVAHHQKIVLYDWLPRWLFVNENFDQSLTANADTFYNIRAPITNDPFNPTCGPYTEYNPNIHPGITQEFQTSAMRFGHTLVTPGLWRRAVKTQNNNLQQGCNWLYSQVQHSAFSGRTHGLRLCNAYWNSQEAVSEDLDALYRGMASTLGEQEDHIMVADLAGDVFGPLEFSRRDLAALNIQRGRDHGLPDYNAVRETFELPRVNTWAGINENATNEGRTARAIQDLQNLYIRELQRTGDIRLNATSPEEVDLFVGGLLETTFDGPGPLFRSILVDQFCRIRDGDRFWYENIENGLFNQTEIDKINNDVDLGYIIARIAKVLVTGQPSYIDGTIVQQNQAEVQADVFIHRGALDPCMQPAALNETTATVEVQNADGSVQTLNLTIIEPCTSFQTFDYFFGMQSELSFIFTFIWIGLVVPAAIGVMVLLAKKRKREMEKAKRLTAKKERSQEPNTYLMVEWVGKNSGDRSVKVQFDDQRKKIHVSDRRGKPLRMIDLRVREGQPKKRIVVWNAEDKSRTVISIRADGEIDLVLKFADIAEKDSFIQHLKTFCSKIGIDISTIQHKEDSIYNGAQTKEDRQKLLDKFFRVVCLQAFKNTNIQGLQLENMDHETVKKIAEIQLTRTEFAESLGLKPTSVFVRNMFLLVDQDRSGFVSFREFLDFFVVLSSDNAEDKVFLIFNMYDIQKRGVLTKKDFTTMIKSLLDLTDSKVDHAKLDELVSSMYRTANVREGSDMTFNDFKKIFASDEYAGTLQKATLNLDGVDRDMMGQGGRHAGGGSLRTKQRTIVKAYTMKDKSMEKSERRKSVHVPSKQTEYPQSTFALKWYELTSFVSTYRLDIFWKTLYFLVLSGIFVERAVYFSIEREHAGLRRIASWGISITRGAASAMMFTYASLLITMSRNMITFFRETFLHRFFPWDSMHSFHKYIAYLALAFTLTHIIGHGVNLYHIASQTSGDLNCYFTEYFRAQDVLASFHYWAYTTITGLTGIILTLIVIVMYVFASPFGRRYAFSAFWFTHGFYILLYILMIMHGLGRLVVPPLTHTYVIGPLVIFTIDKIISLSRNKIECKVIKAELLPSDVTTLVFKKPISYDYKSGQWIRIAAMGLNKNEYHPFTLTSAPHEEFLSLHIRAVGPWTYTIRDLYNPDNIDDTKGYPSVYVDGPYGEGHQDWYRFDVAILVGGGIGVTPFASILKDIVHKSKIADLRFPCKKVYFLWVTRTQKQFEWMTDIIREVEAVDQKNFVETHIFITQFQEKYDLRTTMLYICERHFQKVAGKSLFTGLSATTHFGRPDFTSYLKNIKMEHPNTKQFGVFSCGPPPLTNGLNNSCSILNKQEGATFHHHFENF
ncbi:hypothetical protein FSP39_002883 [Pinctada imbricata]|uniref:NAD(P)H oxidase (H2O2-forming) n=1 Tax=Pinctada imbricata TaxID=66713 RepID=A0AA89BW96_PINIB|nr:hypothetical protein FSP39_002883 [Pinctada imbricata]